MCGRATLWSPKHLRQKKSKGVHQCTCTCANKNPTSLPVSLRTTVRITGLIEAKRGDEGVLLSFGALNHGFHGPRMGLTGWMIAATPAPAGINTNEGTRLFPPLSASAVPGKSETTRKDKKICLGPRQLCWPRETRDACKERAGEREAIRSLCAYCVRPVSRTRTSSYSARPPLFRLCSPAHASSTCVQLFNEPLVIVHIPTSTYVLRTLIMIPHLLDPRYQWEY